MRRRGAGWSGRRGGTPQAGPAGPRRRAGCGTARPARLAGLAPVLLALALLVLAAACARPASPPATPPPPAAPADPPRPSGAPADPLPSIPLPPPEPEAQDLEVQGPADEPRREQEATWSGPILLRVGLASDLPRVELPCCGPGQRLEAGGVAVPASGPVAVEPDPGSAAVLRLQVAALRDEAQAAALARELAARWGWPSDAHFDAGVGLYRVRTGRFPDRPAAEQARGRLEAAGTSGAWIVTEGELVQPALRVVHGARAAAVPGRWLRLTGATEAGEGGGTVRWEGKRYRGDLLVFLNSRGTLNVVNEVPLEDYLRGVVPSEMGPELYPRIESLKAQAVAARTYTLRHLGSFREEGYDLCATPRCQVYGGRGAEHPLSDRAVAETASQVLVHDGDLVDARYSATCGGHTEDVRVVFPDEADAGSGAYLRGVPCIEGGAVVVEGAGLEGTPFPDALTRALLPPPVGAAGRPPSPADALDARLVALAVRAGLPAGLDGGRSGRAGLASTARRDVLRRVAALFDLALGPRVLLASADLPRYAAAPPPEWSREEARQAALLVESGLFTGDPRASLEGGQVERLLFQLARVAGVLRAEELDFHGLDRGVDHVPGGARSGDGEGRLRVRRFGRPGELSLPVGEDLLTFRRRGDALFATDLALVPGDPVTVWFLRRAAGGERPVAVVHDADPARTVADPPHQRARWTRYRSDGELARQVEERYPGLGFTGFRVLRRGVSGRVGAIRLHGRGGRTLDVEGLAVRWTLGLPDTRFTHRRTGGGYRFEGTGWGHGVGLCQTGTFALAGRGVGYRHILRHYYTGVTLARVRSRAPLWDEPAPAAPVSAR